MTDQSQKQRRYIIEDEHEGHKFEWDLTLKPTSYKPGPLIDCTECRGAGRTGGGLGSYDDPEDCWRCGASGKITDPQWPGWHPEAPKELVAALRKAWQDYWNKQQNEKFELTPGE